MPFPEVGEVRAVTRGPHEHLLASYFAINAWSPDNRHLLVLETDVNGRLPQVGERCTPLGAFHVPPAYRPNYWRCDLHARWRPDGKQLAVNSVHEGSRQVYVRDVKWENGK